MITELRSGRIKKYATREMLSNVDCKHAVYGYYYISQGELFQKFADTPAKIKYFNSDTSFNDYVKSLHNEYYYAEDVDVYAVHRNNTLTRNSYF